MRRDGLVSNGDDKTLGNFQPKMVDETIAIQRRTGSVIPDDFTADKIFTNEFVDPGIALE